MFLPFPSSGGCLHSLAHSHITLTSASIATLTPLTLTLLSSSYKNLCDYIRPTGIIWDNLPISKILNLITSAKFLLPCKVTYSQVPKTSGGGEQGRRLAWLFTTRIFSFLCSKCPMLLHVKRAVNSYKGLQGPAWSSHIHHITSLTSNLYQKQIYRAGNGA